MSEYRVLLLGNGGVGKTCFVRKLKYDKFEPRYLATTQVEEFKVGNIVFVDVAGQKFYSKQEVGNIDLILYFYAKDSYLTLCKVFDWNKKFNSDKTIPSLVVETKNDLKSNKAWNILAVTMIPELYSISSKTGNGIHQLLKRIKKLSK